MPLATLSIDLEAKLANLEQGMNRGVQLTQNATRQMQASLDGLHKAAFTLGSVIGTALAGFSLVGFVRSTVDGIDALNDLKDATGASIENISALEDVAARTGTSFDTVGTALVKFNKVLSDAKPGNETSKILKTIGLDAEALKKIDPAEALRQTAVAFSKYADDGGKARGMQELFGKSLREIAPFMTDLATQTKLVATLTTQQAAEAEKLNQALDSLSKNSKDAARSMLKDLVPALDAMARGFNQGGIKGSLDALGDQIGLGAEFHERRAIKQLRSTIDDLQVEKSRLETLNRFLPEGFGSTQAIDAVNEKLTKRVAELEVLRVKYLRLNEGAAGGGRGFVNMPFTPGLPELKVPGEHGKESEFDKRIKQLTEMQIATLNLSAVEQARLDIDLEKYGKLNSAQQVLLLSLSKGIDLSKAEADFRGPTIDTEELRMRNELQKQLNSLLDSLPTSKLEELQRLQGALQERFEQGALSGEKLAEGLTLLASKYEELSPKTKEAIDDMQKFSEQFATTATQTLGDTVFDVLSGNFDNIEKSWSNMLKRMAAQAIAQDIGEQLFGNKKEGKSGLIGIALNAILSNANGNAFGAGGVQAFARGDIFSSPTMFAYGGSNLGIMGEAGPEAVMPLKRGKDGKLGVAGGGQSVTFDFSGQVIHVGQGVSRGEVKAAVNAGNAETEVRIRRLLRNGNI